MRNDGLWMNSGGIERPRVVTKVIETIPLNTNTGEILRDVNSTRLLNYLVLTIK